MAFECNANSICRHMLMLINVHFTIMIVSTSINTSNSLKLMSASEINHYDSYLDYYYKTSEPTTSFKPQHYRRHHKTAYEMNINDLQQTTTATTQQANTPNKSNTEQLPQEQKLALQIFITDPSNGRKTSGVQHKKHSNILIGKKRPYDVVKQSSLLEDTILSNNHHLKTYSPSERHFYMLNPPLKSPQQAISDESNSTTNNISISISNRTGSFNNSEPPLLKVLASDDQRETSTLRKPISNNKIELVRTQHRPPWRKKPPSQSLLLLLPHMKSSFNYALFASPNSTITSTTTPAPTLSTTTPRSLNSEADNFRSDPGDSDSKNNSLAGRRNIQLISTTLSPISTTTEFYKLISSAHSPVDTATESLHYMPSRRRINGKPFGSNSMDNHDQYYDNVHNHQKLSAATRNRIHELLAAAATTTTTTATPTTTFPTSIQTRYKPSSSITTLTNNNFNMSDGHVVSPEILVGGSNEDIGNLKKRGNLVRLSGINRNGALGEIYSRPQPSLNFTSTPDEVPSTVFDGKRKVTIIRHSTKVPPPPVIITKHPPTSEPISLQFSQQHQYQHQHQHQHNQEQSNQIPNRIKIDDSIVNSQQLPNFNSSIMPANQLVRMISKHKNKYDDNVKSHTLTVVDNDAIRLPPNATSVHNKLIVAIRPGRPRRYPSTTQFPVYNIVAGITPPSIPIINNQTQSPFVRPNSPEGSVFGLLKPTEATTTPQPASTFGAQNIRFPAQPPTLQSPPEHIEIQDKLNISIPDSASNVGPHKIPDKILMETEEQHERPPDALVISDATIVSRPYGSNTVINQDGIMKLGTTTTTRKPARQHYTTRRINIVASNTTVVHQFNHPTHQTNIMRPPPPTKPSFLVYLGNIFNAGITTSAIAVLTLIKTVFTIILVMFLPPIALTAAITQAIALG